MRDLATALALAVAIEGMLYSVLPHAMQRMTREVGAMPETALRAAGFAAAVLGVGAVWLIRS